MEKRIEFLAKEYHITERDLKRARKEYKEAKEGLTDITEANSVLQEVASNVQRVWYEHLGKIVSKCLSAVFSEEAYELKLVFKQLANRTQVQFLLERDLEEFDPLTSTGGGIVDVASFALRLAAMMLDMQGQRKCLICDEPFRFVSAEYRPPVRLLLEKLASEFQVQLIIVTHIDELEIGEVVRLS